jgi:branched-chain amino acid transport system substrate-binding protein
MGDAALGLKSAAHWSPDLDTPANKAFTADFEAAYGRLPSLYAAQAYDAARLIDAAVRKVGGDLSDKAALGQAVASASFASIRPDFALNRNHFPVQSYYLREVVKDGKGRLVNALRGTILTRHGDAYVGECPL